MSFENCLFSHLISWQMVSRLTGGLGRVFDSSSIVVINDFTIAIVVIVVPSLVSLLQCSWEKGSPCALRIVCFHV